MNNYRTHTCGELTEKDIGKTVIISGWLNKKRDHGGLLFFDIRDNMGLTQCVIDTDNKMFPLAEKTRLESVVKIEGNVLKRSEDTVNKNISSGLIEVKIQKMEILNESKTLPFQVAQEDDAPEEIRLKYRFLDLRKKRLKNNIILRSETIKFMRKKMIEQGFFEIQTPILSASSPEGARDYLVPSRVNPGKFYALPQAPQIFKQLLMVSGFEKYFQIAPCFRDEDARADRSPGEFYQLDFEMSFVEQDDIFEAIEPLIYELFKKYSSSEVTNLPFKKITYEESIRNYGTDKPDLRNPLLIKDITECFKDSGFKIFDENIKKGHIIKSVILPNSSKKPRGWFDKMNDWARKNNQKGLGYIIFEDGEGKGPIANNLKKNNLDLIINNTDLQNGDTIFFISNYENEATIFASQVREKLCDEMKLRKTNRFEFCWIIDYPMYEINRETGKIDFSHNPFSMPQGGLKSLENLDPLKILAWQFDIVCNGVELSSGAIRNHKTEIMTKAFQIAGYSENDLKNRFGGLYKAFQYGAPPHGGCAPGIDRIVMLIANENNLREIVPFPMNQQAEDLMLGAPDHIDEKHLTELNLLVRKKEKK